MSLRDTINHEKASQFPLGQGLFPLSQDWERGRVRVGGVELMGSSFLVITLTPPSPVSRERECRIETE